MKRQGQTMMYCLPLPLEVSALQDIDNFVAIFVRLAPTHVTTNE